MKVEQTLTKENFWNQLHSDYPEAMQIFCDWIDEYKKEVDWDNLFKPKTALNTIFYTKFHDIPHAMQMGIWFAFVIDQGGCLWEIEDTFDFVLSEEITEWMRHKQGDIDYDKEYPHRASWKPINEKKS